MIKKAVLSIALLTLSTATLAEPTSQQSAKILKLRAYNDGAIYITLDASVICDTNVFKIVGSDQGSDKMYSTALSAFVASKPVKVEIYNSTGCAGWGTSLQSIYILN